MKITHIALIMKNPFLDGDVFHHLLHLKVVSMFHILSHSLVHVRIFTLEESALKKKAACSSKIFGDELLVFIASCLRSQ